MTKSEELNALRQFIGAHPGTYIADLLGDALPTIDQLITNDLCFGLADHWNGLRRDIGEETQRLHKLHCACVAAETRATDAERRAAKAQRELDEIRATARSLAAIGVR